MSKPLSLREARKQGRLDEFVAQAETDGVGPADLEEFNEAVRKIVRPQQSAGRRSRSPYGDGSSGS